MSTSKRLGLTRDQLKAFLGDHEQIKQFEKLFTTVDAIAPDVVETINIAAGAAEAKAVQALDLIASLQSEIQGLQSAPPPRELKRTRYGQFLDTTTQVAALANTAQAITFNTTDLSYGVYLQSGNTKVTVDTEGIYNFQFSIQLDKTAGGVASFWIWPRLNGTDVPDSASQIRVQGNNAEIFSAANFFFDLKANDYVEFMFAVSDVSVELAYFPATGFHPGIPSIILTVSNNIRGPL